MSWPLAVAHGSRYRLPKLRTVEELVAGLDESVGVDFAGARVRVGFGRGHLLEVVVHAAQFGERGLQDAAERLVEGVLGERAFDDWVGAVRTAPLTSRGPLKVVDNQDSATFPLSDLATLAQAAIDGLIDGLPARPLHERVGDAGWSLFELEPAPADDYAEQDDLVIATTCEPELLKAFLAGAPIFSGRFSRHDEVFCYLKLGGSTGDLERRLEERSALENALSQALVPDGLGCVFGNGMGLRYTYVDLALAQPARALPRIVEVARAAEASRESWLMPCDFDAQGSWVPVWDDGPAPPVRHA